MQNYTRTHTHTHTQTHTNQIPTFPGGLKAVVDVYPLDVVRERGVGEEGSVPVDCVQRKFKG